MKKLVVVIHSSMFDASFSLIKRLKTNYELTCIFEIDCFDSNMLGIGLSDFQGNYLRKAVEIEKLAAYKDYFPEENSYAIMYAPPSHLSSFYRGMRCETKLLKKLDYDILYFYNGSLLATEHLFFSSKKGIIVNGVHDPILHSSQKHKCIHEWIRKKVFRKCNYFVLFSEALVQPFSQQYNIDESRVFLSHLGPYEILNKKTKPFVSQQKGSLKLLFFGFIKSYKGLKYLLEAYKSLDQRDVELTIAGRGYIEPNIIDLENTKGLHIINRYIDTEELASIITNSDVVICPYIDATQSGVIMSTYAFCKPVIATNVGGLKEMVIDGKTGALIPPKNITALIKVISNIQKNKAIIDEWSQNIFRIFIEGEKSWDSIAKDYDIFFSSINN